MSIKPATIPPSGPCKPGMPTLVGRLAILCAALIPATLTAQENGSTLVEPERLESRLDAMESLYQQRAAENREPLLRRYIEDLTRLEATLRRDSRERSAAAVAQEIERATKALAEGIEIEVPRPSTDVSSGRDLLAVATSRAPISDERPAFVLPGSSSTGVKSTWKDIQAEPEILGSDSASIGSRSWTVENLPSGRYEVVLAYESDPGVVGARLRLRVGEDADVNTRINPMNSFMRDGALTYIFLGTITIDRELEKVEVEATARGSRMRQEDPDRPVKLRAALLLPR